MKTYDVENVNKISKIFKGVIVEEYDFKNRKIYKIQVLLSNGYTFAYGENKQIGNIKVGSTLLFKLNLYNFDNKLSNDKYPVLLVEMLDEKTTINNKISNYIEEISNAKIKAINNLVGKNKEYPFAILKEYFEQKDNELIKNNNSYLFKLTTIYVEKLFNSVSYKYSFDSNQSIQILTGPNGLGKTTILKLITFVYSFYKYCQLYEDFTILPYQYISVIENKLNLENDSLDIVGALQNISFSKINFVFESKNKKIIFSFSKNKDSISINLFLDSIEEYKERNYTFEIRGDILIWDPELKEEKDFRLIIFEIGECVLLKSSRIAGSAFNKFINFSFLPFVEKNFNNLKNDANNILQSFKKIALPGYEINYDFSKRISELNFDSHKLQHYLISLTCGKKNESLENSDAKNDKFNSVNSFLDKYDKLTKHFKERYENSFNKKLLFYDINDSCFRIVSYKDYDKTKLIFNKFEHFGPLVGEDAAENENNFFPIDKLSSGELNDLIVIYNIIFNKSSLLLIDEPEISLHIEWQMNFLSEILKFASSKNQIIIATHSPYILGEEEDNDKYVADFELFDL